jgi:hypothetical protein
MSKPYITCGTLDTSGESCSNEQSQDSSRSLVRLFSGRIRCYLYSESGC